MNGQMQKYPFDSTKSKQARGQPARPGAEKISPEHRPHTPVFLWLCNLCLMKISR